MSGIESDREGEIDEADVEDVFGLVGILYIVEYI